MNLNLLQNGAKLFGLDLSDAQMDAFRIFACELIEWNERINLTAITDPDQIVIRHFLDSLSVAPLLPSAPPAALVDIGAGAGFPGVPLKIALPHLRVTLLDATRKKVDFVQYLIAKLDLQGISPLQSRAEDGGRDPALREHFDVAVARAVADLAVLSEFALPYVRVGGVFIAQKGVRVDEELEGASHSLSLLGGRVHEIVPVRLPGLEERHLIVIDKIAATPAEYPRRAGLPERNPLR